MSDYHFISDYKHNKQYRESFFKLARTTFGIEFENWFERGGWKDKYICYSYVDDGQVIANASINKMTIVTNGTEYKTIQVGTVMTHPDYRNQGLSGKLMNYILAKYEQEYDFIYLFANETVLDFYPKFGFEHLQESSFSLQICDYKRPHSHSSTIRKLDPDNPTDFNMLEKFANEKISISSILSVKHNEDLLMFYYMLPFKSSIYYIEAENVIVIYQQEGIHLHIFDIISTTKVEIDIILNSVITAETEIINFYFTPDFGIDNIHTELITKGEDTLFIRPLRKDFPKHFMFPLTSHA